ncbi:MAG: UvrD-helicase domain-containing protein [Rectinema sp.]|nr:UvrD-helicase domain-containing protein [Rectinema sp.]
MSIDFKAELDPDQLVAVTTTEGPLLIIAGAGSGKTRVITYRIAYLLSRGVPQDAILALTFTNKAAREMIDRAHTLTGLPLRNLMVSTFHSFGAWVLRHEAAAIGLRPNFSIYDELDQVHAIRECAREMGLAIEQLDVAALAQSFSAIRAGFGSMDDLTPRERELYDLYRRTLRIYNAVDFDDLIAMPLELFRHTPAIRNKYRARFRYVMIDEFQDTSLQQYELIREIESGNICVVGDDDQSIYSWRGADYRNMERFEADHPGLVEIKLERNYRSTGSILSAANTVIAHNRKRKQKQLWSPLGKTGTPIHLSSAENEEEEAARIVARMKELRFRDHAGWEDFGILVRTNALADCIENELVEHNIPYRVAGGPSFYQRREIRDIVAYLRAVANPDDDVSVLRIINVPRRGIGRATIEHLSHHAKSNHCSLHASVQSLSRADVSLSHQEASVIRGLAESVSFFEYLAMLREGLLHGRLTVSSAIRAIVQDIGYWQYLLEEHKKNEKAAVWKYRNLELLASSAERWEKDPDTLDRSIFAWLARISLTVRDDAHEEEGRVSLLTIHAAKGLEFEYVFIPGCEHGIIPHARALEESEGDIEEERRLFYVAVTRARKELYLSRALRRHRSGSEKESAPSPFLDELPKDLVVDMDVEAAKEESDEEALKSDFFNRMRQRLGAMTRD